MKRHDQDTPSILKNNPQNNSILEVGAAKTQEEVGALSVVAGDKSSPPLWRENPYLPTQPLLRDPETKALYLAKLRELRYEIRAAHAVGVSLRTVQRRKIEDPDFAVAVDHVVMEQEAEDLAKIEPVSISEAVKPGRNSDRLKQLDALAPAKYRRKDGGVQVATQVNIVLGYTPPNPPAMRKGNA